MNRLLFILLLCVGCSSPVLKLRAIGENQEDRQVSYATSDLLDRASNAAFLGENEASMRMPSANLVAKRLHKIDRRFDIEVNNDSVLMVRW